MQSINTTDAFKSTIESDKPVIVKFKRLVGVLIVNLWTCGLINRRKI